MAEKGRDMRRYTEKDRGRKWGSLMEITMWKERKRKTERERDIGKARDTDLRYRRQRRVGDKVLDVEGERLTYIMRHIQKDSDQARDRKIYTVNS